MSAQRKGKHPKKMVRAGEHSDVDGRRTSVPTSETNTGSRIRVVGSRIYDSVNGKSCHQVIFAICLASMKIWEKGDGF